MPVIFNVDGKLIKLRERKDLLLPLNQVADVSCRDKHYCSLLES
jgi:hypothetical protein